MVLVVVMGDPVNSGCLMPPLLTETARNTALINIERALTKHDY